MTRCSLTLSLMVSSAGGLAAVRHVLEHLLAAFPAAIVIVQHLDPRHRSLMAGILSHHTELAVKEAEEGDRLPLATCTSPRQTGICS